MLFPEINEDLGSELTGVVALSQYDRAFLLSVVNVSRFWGTLTNEQQGYVEALEYRIMADDITVLLQEIRDAIMAGGAGGSNQSPTVSFNPQVSFLPSPCGCPEDAGLTKPSPCIKARGRGGYWAFQEYYNLPAREDGGLFVTTQLEAGDYVLLVENYSSPEPREFDILLSYDGGGAYVPLFFFGGYSESNPYRYSFTIGARSDLELSIQLKDGFAVGETYVRASICKRKPMLGSRNETELDVKPRLGSRGGTKGGFSTLTGGAKYEGKPKDTPFSSFNSFDGSETIYKMTVQIFFEMFPDLQDSLKAALRTFILALFPSLGVVAFADAVELEVFGSSIFAYNGEFIPEGDGFLLVIDFELPAEGIPALFTDPSSWLGFMNFKLDVVTTSENETLTEFLLQYAAYFLVKWAKVLVDTGGVE